MIGRAELGRMFGVAPCAVAPDGVTLPSRKVSDARKKVPGMGDANKIHHEYERVVVSREGATAREIRIYGSGGRLIFEGWQVADDGGQTAWISDAAAIVVFGEPLYPGETTEAGPLWLFDNFAEVKEMGSCSPPFMAEVAKALGERYEPA